MKNEYDDTYKYEYSLCSNGFSILQHNVWHSIEYSGRLFCVRMTGTDRIVLGDASPIGLVIQVWR